MTLDLTNIPRVLQWLALLRPDAPLLLDAFCGAGGAAVGYWRAGFNVIGVDIAPQPHYPFPFVQMDAIEAIRALGPYVDAIHASPPCQGYANSVYSTDSRYVRGRGKLTARMIGQTRVSIITTSKPYVIENVSGSQDELHASLMLCGSMFGDIPARHRFFECSHWIPQPQHLNCRGHNIRLAYKLGVEVRDVSVAGKSRRAGSIDTWKLIMGAHWMATGHELSESIPPAYTEYIGRQLMRVVRPDAEMERAS
jgi:DNA (cytosine-5)-methyltransferase 1